MKTLEILRVGYSIISLDMFGFFQDYEVVEMDPLFSDGHCLLRSVLRFDLFLPNEENIQSPPYKPKWKLEYCNDFIQHIDCTKINSLLTTWENIDISKDTINFVIKLAKYLKMLQVKLFQNQNIVVGLKINRATSLGLAVTVK